MQHLGRFGMMSMARSTLCWSVEPKRKHPLRSRQHTNAEKINNKAAVNITSLSVSDSDRSRARWLLPRVTESKRREKMEATQPSHKEPPIHQQSLKWLKTSKYVVSCPVLPATVVQSLAPIRKQAKKQNRGPHVAPTKGAIESKGAQLPRVRLEA